MVLYWMLRGYFWCIGCFLLQTSALTYFSRLDRVHLSLAIPARFCLPSNEASLN